jgi:membrane associated rhomboid family serine protease
MLNNSPATRRLLFINIGIYLMTLIMPGPLYKLFALHDFGSHKFIAFQLLTYQFLHAIGPLHIIFNMMILVVFGSVVESKLGSARLTSYYLLSGVVAGLLHNLTIPDETLAIAYMKGTDVTLVGASGSVWGLLAMFALLVPNEKLYLFFLPVGIKAKWAVSAFFAIELLSAFIVRDNVSHFAHVGGALTGAAIYFYEKKRVTV